MRAEEDGEDGRGGIREGEKATPSWMAPAARMAVRERRERACVLESARA